MKNIHILPTDQPSRLVKIKDTFFITSSVDIPGGTFYNIHITSDEELPYDDSIFATGAFYHRDAAKDIHIITKDTFHPNPNFCSRIILTTDDSLFKYGVQAIDDEFLEWFVKNSSCEFVEIDKIPDLQSYNEKTHKCELVYTIIIPQEGDKQDWYCPKCQSYVSSESVTFEETHQTCNTSVIIEESKQETLEEAAEKEFPLIDTEWCRTGDCEEENLHLLGHRKSFIKGAKKQSEKMYSEEEVFSILDKVFHMYASNHRKDAKNWFENFKKK